MLSVGHSDVSSFRVTHNTSGELVANVRRFPVPTLEEGNSKPIRFLPNL